MVMQRANTPWAKSWADEDGIFRWRVKWESFKESRSMRYRFVALPEEPTSAINVLTSGWFEFTMGVFVLMNILMLVLETDSVSTVRLAVRLAGDTPDGLNTLSNLSRSDALAAKDRLDVLRYINVCFVLVYIVELVARLTLMPPMINLNRWLFIDVVVVALGVLEECLRLAVGSDDAASASILQTLRVLRLMRLARFVVAFQGCNFAFRLLCTCFTRTIWSGFLGICFATAWSVVAVEYIHPIASDVAGDGAYDSVCNWCPSAFSSVMSSNRTLFYAVLLGDGLSALARPIVERDATAGILLALAVVVLVCGIFNLIAAAFFDCFQEVRSMSHEMMWETTNSLRQQMHREITRMTEALDTNHSGGISLYELNQGFEMDEGFRAYLATLGIERDDLAEAFRYQRLPRGSELCSKEFRRHIYKMTNMELKSTLYNVSRDVQLLLDRQEDILAKMIDPNAPVKRASFIPEFGGRINFAATERNSLALHRNSLSLFVAPGVNEWSADNVSTSSDKPPKDGDDRLKGSAWGRMVHSNTFGAASDGTAEEPESNPACDLPLLAAPCPGPCRPILRLELQAGSPANAASCPTPPELSARTSECPSVIGRKASPSPDGTGSREGP